jgi:hypothetical protein
MRDDLEDQYYDMSRNAYNALKQEQARLARARQDLEDLRRQQNRDVENTPDYDPWTGSYY